MKERQQKHACMRAHACTHACSMGQPGPAPASALAPAPAQKLLLKAVSKCRLLRRGEKAVQKLP